MNYELDLDKDLLLSALMLAGAQRARALTKFKPGSAAYLEIDKQRAEYHAAETALRRLPTPLEKAIDNEVARRSK